MERTLFFPCFADPVWAWGKFDFFAEKLQYRPIGFFWTVQIRIYNIAVRGQAGGKFDPRRVRNRAARKVDTLADGKHSHECDWL